MNIYAIIGLVITLAAALGTSHFGAYRAGINSEKVKQQAESVLIDKVKDAAIVASAEAIAKIEVKNVTNQQIIRQQIKTNTVYRECKHTPDGLRAVNEALTAPERRSTSDSQLPRPDNPK